MWARLPIPDAVQFYRSSIPFCAYLEYPGGSDFGLDFENLQIPLGSSINPIYSRQIHARVEDFKADLGSPCLMVGENGRGKSLIAKILAGAISHQGTAEFIRGEKSGPPRLLFQDVIMQFVTGGAILLFK